jgi:hypothetical protein
MGLRKQNPVKHFFAEWKVLKERKVLWIACSNVITCQSNDWLSKGSLRIFLTKLEDKSNEELL